MTAGRPLTPAVICLRAAGSGGPDADAPAREHRAEAAVAPGLAERPQVVVAGARRRRGVGPRGPVQVEHVLLDRVHGSTLLPPSDARRVD
jgi:hypothetical protein